MAKMCQRTMPYPIVRSILPVIIGHKTAKESSAMTDLLSIMALKFRSVGKVLGKRIENSMINSTAKIGSP
jgi:hypothetical protein